MMRKGIVFFAILFACVGALGFFRHHLILPLLPSLIHRNLGVDFAFDRCSFDKGRYIYEDVQVGSDLSIKSCEFSFSCSFLPFFFETSVCLDAPSIDLRGSCKTPRPQKIDDFEAHLECRHAGTSSEGGGLPLTLDRRAGEEALDKCASKGRFYGGGQFCNSLLSSGMSKPFFPLLIPGKYFGVTLDIDNGALGSDLSFTLASGPANDQIGTLVVYDETDPGEDPLLYADITYNSRKQIRIESMIGPAPLDRLQELSAIFFPFNETECSGNVSGQGVITIEPNGQIVAVEADIAGTDIHIRADKTELFAQDFALKCQSQEEALFAAEGFLRGGRLQHGALIASEIEGSFTALPDQVEEVTLRGDWMGLAVNLMAQGHRVESGYEVQGEAALAGEKVHFAALLDTAINCERITLQADKLTSMSLQPLLDFSRQDVCLDGAVSLDAVFEQGQVNGAFTGTTLAFNFPSASVYFPDGQEYAVVFDPKAISGTVSVKGVQARLKNSSASISDIEGVVDFSLDGLASEAIAASAVLHPDLTIKHLQGALSIEQTGFIQLTKLQGEMYFRQQVFGFFSPELVVQDNQLNGTLHVSHQGDSFAELALSHKDGSLSLSGQVFSSHIDQLSMQFKDPFDLVALDSRAKVCSDDLPKAVQLLQKLNLFDGDMLPLSSLQGDMEAVVAFHPPSDWTLQVIGTNFSLKGKKISRGWEISSLRIGDVALSGSIFASEPAGRWQIPSWEAIYQHNVHLKGSAVISKGEALVEVFSIEGLLPPRYRIRTVQPVKYNFKEFHNLDAAIMEGPKTVFRLQAKKTAYNTLEQCWEAANAKIFAAHDQLVDPLQGIFTVRLGKNLFSLQGTTEHGAAEILGNRIKAKEAALLYEPPFMNVKLRADLGGSLVQIKARLDVLQEMTGGVTIQKEGASDLIACSLGNNFSLRALDAVWEGIEAHLDEKHIGSVHIVDGKKAAVFLGDTFSFLQDTSGLFCSGKWDLKKDDLSFDGKVEGRNSVLAGYLVDALSAKLAFSSQAATISNLMISDAAATVQIKEARFEKKTPSGPWTYFIPFVKAQGISPSLIRRANQFLPHEKQEQKPLLLRNILLTHLSGTMGDVATVQARGRCNFTNVFRKEIGLFDAPIQMLKDLGLDIGVFTPALGEVEFRLQGSKIELTALKACYSEGGRSEFFLCKEPSFIDLNGPISIDLSMKQNVAVKLAEPFSLCIRGTLDKPRYFLR